MKPFLQGFHRVSPLATIFCPFGTLGGSFFLNDLANRFPTLHLLTFDWSDFILRPIERRKESQKMPGVLMRAFRSLMRKSRAERELDEELRFHIEQQIEQNIRLGMSPEEARAEARRAFGGVEQAKERSRD